MALTPLASVADLQSKGIDVTTHPDRVTSFLASASAEVRDAAGVPILRDTFTVEIPGVPDQWLTVPGKPVTAVSSLLLDGTAITDWKRVGGDLWRAGGWLAVPWEPCEVTLTITGGLLEVPDDIIDLVAGLVGLALAESEDGYQSRGDLAGVRIDDAGEQYVTSSQDRTAGVMELPQATRARLRARFGGGVSVLRQR